MQVLTNALNIGLDFLFVFGFGWESPASLPPRSSRNARVVTRTGVRMADPSNPARRQQPQPPCSIGTA